MANHILALLPAFCGNSYVLLFESGSPYPVNALHQTVQSETTKPTGMYINLVFVHSAASYVSGYFKAALNGCFVYYNLSHTCYVVTATNRPCRVINIDEEKKSILLTAGWFHDLGFTVRRRARRNGSKAG